MTPCMATIPTPSHICVLCKEAFYTKWMLTEHYAKNHPGFPRGWLKNQAGAFCIEFLLFSIVLISFIGGVLYDGRKEPNWRWAAPEARCDDSDFTYLNQKNNLWFCNPYYQREKNIIITKCPDVSHDLAEVRACVFKNCPMLVPYVNSAFRGDCVESCFVRKKVGTL